MTAEPTAATPPPAGARPGKSEVDAVDDELAARLRLSVMRLARRLRQQADADVTASQLSALSSLARRGPLTLGELSAAERVKPPTMTRIVASLEDLGLVTRSADPADRRVARVAVSADGLRFIDRSRHRKDAYLAARMGALTPADQAILAAAADALEHLLEVPE
ncbi:MAG TPA: MarR family transcriptional regulator [Acidimicrobiales bacterium]|nr:MarR family transcriptional regulator [Acidimicrobiales bacterium]